MLKEICIEMSLKPFRRTDGEYMRGVIENMFEQWRPLIKDYETISVMLWSADGSEILEYGGSLGDSFEWAKYIGIANAVEKWAFEQDPDGVGLHTRCHEYIDNPPIMTYAILKEIVSLIKSVGAKMFSGRKIRVGATFDPGPEFAKSPFKFSRHPEICTGKMGSAKSVCSDSVLNADGKKYAGFPNGIADKTPFGTFFGRQSEHFLKDMGFDYLWLSNGFGFGTQPWGYKGSIFDGKVFHSEKLEAVKEKNLAFWKLFRAECDVPLETRGTNLIAGIDYAADGVSLKDIYGGGFDVAAPPNSPWAALDGDFGLELAGYMSKTAYLPDGKYMFRYYIHDPWWYNDPWVDMYERCAHDIYLPLSVACMDENGKTAAPYKINLFTADDSHGLMDESIPNEVIPHIKAALLRFPDAPPPVLWVYPFEYYQSISGSDELRQMYSEEWFVRGAINNGFPLAGVVSAENFIKTVNMGIYDACIVFTPVPDKNCELEAVLEAFIKNGGKVMFYGSTANAGGAFLNMLGLAHEEPLAGSMEVTLCGEKLSKPLSVDSVISGSISEVCKDGALAAVSVCAESGAERAFAVCKNVGMGKCVWMRAVCSVYQHPESMLLVPQKASEYFISESLPRILLKELGVTIEFGKRSEDSKNPVILISRNDNAFMFSGFMSDTTVRLKLKTEYGAPLMIGAETYIEDGCSVYCFPRAWRHECRAFVIKNEGEVIKCAETTRNNVNIERSFKITGLKNAEVIIFPPKGREHKTIVLANARYPYIKGDPIDVKLTETADGFAYIVSGASGALVIGFEKD